MRRPSVPKLRRSAKPVPAGLGGPVPLGASQPSRSRRRPPIPVLIVAVLAIAGIVLLVRSCGSDDSKDVRRTVERFAQASRDKNYQALCDDLFSTAIVENLRSTGQPCEVALKEALSDVQNPTVEVRSVKVDGNKAQARTDSTAAGQRPSTDTVQLIKEDGGWRISSLANEAPSDTTP